MAKSRFVAEEKDYTISSAKSKCNTCKHKTKGKATCVAFPKKIPRNILQGDECSSSNGVKYETM